MKKVVFLAFLFATVTNYAQNDEFFDLAKKQDFSNATKMKAAFKSKGIADEIRSIFLDDRAPDVRNEFSSEGSFVVGTMEEAPDGSKGAIVFETGKWQLDNTSKVVLSNFVNVILEAVPDVNITVSGHTESVGSEAFNYKLSEKRAMAVKDFLILKGIKPSKIRTMGFGEEQPIYSNSTSNGRAMNRRVEFDFY